jgi:hypothetical protein
MTKPKHELTEATLISVPDPFGKPRIYSSLGHLTFAEMAARCDQLPLMFWDGGGAIIVTITDDQDRVVRQFRVPRDIWHISRPKCEPHYHLTVAFGVNMQGGGGGGGGGKNVLAIVAMVAVIAAGAWVSGGGLAGSFGSAFASGTVGAKVAAAAVTVAGAMAIGALSKPPTVPDFGQPDPKTPNTSLAQVNVMAAGAPLPRVLGTKKIFPPAICEPLTEYIDDDVVTEYVLGLAGPHGIPKQTVMIGGKPIPEGAACEIRRGHTSDRLQRLITRYGHTDHVNLQLSNFKHTGHFSEDNNAVRLGAVGDEKAVKELLPQWHSVFLRHASQQTGGPIDEHHINLTFPAGLYNTVDGPSDMVVMPFRGRIRRIAANGKPGAWVNLPEFHYVRSYEGQFTFSLRFRWQKGGRPARPPSRTDRRGGMWAYTSVLPQTAIPASSGWEADSYFIDEGRRQPGAEVYSAITMDETNLLNMVGKKDRWEVYLDPKVFVPGQYELQLKRGAPQHASLWKERKRLQQTEFTSRYDVFWFFWWRATSGFTRQDLVTYYPDGMIAEVVVSSVVAVINAQPSPGKDVCAISLRLKNVGNAGAISCIASGLVPDWNGTAWAGLNVTSNPAPHARDILNGTLNALSVPNLLIDDDDFVALRQRCGREGYEVNAEIKGMSVPEALDLTLGCGFAGQRNAEQFGCTYERDRSDEGVTQTFTPRNMANFRISKAFPQLSDGMRCIYTDKNNDYQDSNVTVLYGTKKATIEEVRYEGLVTQGEVVRRARFDLNHSRLRLAEYSWTAPLEFIRCRKGDLVGVQTDVIMVKSGWGRIMSKTVNGNDRITSFVLDQTLPAFRAITGQITIPQATFGVAIQRKNGSVTTHAVTVDADRRTVTLNTPIDNTSDIAEGTLVTAGSLGNEFTRLIIKEIIPKDSTSAEILAFEEAPSLLRVLEARTAEIADASTGAPIPSMLDFRYPQNSGYLAAA